MNLVLDDEQRQIRDGATQLFRDRGGVSRLRALRDARDATGFSPAVWAEMARLGWLGMTVPEALGGVGLGLSELCLVSEAAGRVLAPEPVVGHAMAIDALVLGHVADDATRSALLARIIAGGVGALAWDESRMRGDVERIATEVRAEGDQLVLYGAKQDVIAGAAAELFVVAARGPEPDALGLWLVPAAAIGIHVMAQRRLDHHPVARVGFDAVSVTASDRLSHDAMQPRELLLRVLDRGTVVAAAELVGSAAAAFDLTLAYLKDRQQFGVAIGSFQALRHRAARMYIALELARSAVMAAARMIDGGLGDPRAVGQAVSLAKARANDAALLIGDEAIQMHGGIGMTDEHDIGLYFKRVRVAATALGDSAWHRDRWARFAGY